MNSVYSRVTVSYKWLGNSQANVHERLGSKFQNYELTSKVPGHHFHFNHVVKGKHCKSSQIQGRI